MNCCQCCGIDKVFSAKVAAKELKAYRKNGPHKATSVLIDALKAEGAEGMTLLDIGGGVGAIQHELLKDGVTTATNVDASSAYSEAAKQEADRLGLSDRVTYHFGDFVGGYVNRCVNDIRRRPSQPLIQWRFHPHTVHRDRRLRSTQGPSDA